MNFVILLWITWIINLQAFACKLTNPIVSLSGGVTLQLEKFDLLIDPKLKAISHFHPVKAKMPKDKILKGGIFLNHRDLNFPLDTVFFIDASEELKKQFSSSRYKNTHWINTRNLDPFESVKYIEDKLGKYLLNCEEKIQIQKKWISSIRSKKTLKNLDATYVFFLGNLDTKYPDLIISNDGVVKYLKNFNWFKTYPSDLAYIRWSQKMMKQLKNVIYLGVSSQLTEDTKFIEVKSHHFNYYHPKALIPGLAQVEYLEDFFNQF